MTVKFDPASMLSRATRARNGSTDFVIQVCCIGTFLNHFHIKNVFDVCAIYGFINFVTNGEFAHDEPYLHSTTC